VFLHTIEERVARLDRAHVVLDQLLDAVGERPSGPIRLNFDVMDTVLGGLEETNAGSDQQVGLLLTMLSNPPRWIIEAPSDATLAKRGRPYDFASLWDRFVRFHAKLYRLLVLRYAVHRPLIGLCALEVVNEPDYGWIPEEVKIEGVSVDLLNPLGKYVTELHLSQVPSGSTSGRAFERAPWGFQEQDAGWRSEPGPPSPVLTFDWGPKFDWYVKCFTELQAEVAKAIKDEGRAHGVEVTTVSGSVTHNNIDYLLRMHRANPRAFADIDKIGLHPYHWVNHDVWDRQFVSDEPIEGWAGANPRDFARMYLKRFDFLRTFRESSGDHNLDAEIKTVFGDRKLWITEFGIGSKVLGAFNAPIAEYTRFIRPRRLIGATVGEPDIIWEDMWNSFLDQVDGDWLQDHGVECLLLYALRDVGIPAYDLSDEDRSNFALLNRDGSPRIDAPVLERLTGLIGGMTSRRPAWLAPPSADVPAELYRRPWRAIELSESARAVMTMLSLEERQLLYWLTSAYWSGTGAIVDGGCFVGGSTVPLAEGLRAAGRHSVVDVYDLFKVEPYMTDFYFKDHDLSAGDSFRPLFDANTAHLADLLQVHAGNLTSERWRGEPIEILFVDFSKSWALNDFIVSEFFPCLIPGRSIVVQQDAVFAGCPWVALTMEAFSNYFEPVGFAEHCSIVYLCTNPIPRSLAPVSALPHVRRIELMDQVITRFQGSPRAVLECAKATLLIEHGDFDAAQLIIDRVAAEGPGHYSVRAAVEQCISFLAGRTVAR
jgi:hypothetical protein